MKKLGLFIARFGIAILMNVLTLLSSILNILDFVRLFAISIIERIPSVFTVILGFAGIVGTLVYIFNPLVFTFSAIIGKLLFILLLWLIVGLLFRFSEAISTFLSLLLVAILAILRVDLVVSLLCNCIRALGDCYLRCCDDDTRFIEYFFAFGSCWALYWMTASAVYAQQILAFLAYPAFAAGGIWVGYWLCFVEIAPPELWSLEWWLGIGTIAFCMIVSAFMAYVFNEMVETSMFEADSGLLEVLERHWNVYKRTAPSRPHLNAAVIEQPVNNAYYTLLSCCKNFEDLESNYRRIAKTVHPDTSTLLGEEAHYEMAQLNEAYDYLRQKFM